MIDRFSPSPDAPPPRKPLWLRKSPALSPEGAATESLLRRLSLVTV